MLNTLFRAAGRLTAAALLAAALTCPAHAQKSAPKKAAPAAKPAAGKAAPAKTGTTAPADSAKTAPKAKAIGSTYKLSTDPATFPDDVRRLLETTSNAKVVTETAMMFQSTWSADRFSAPQQQRIIALAQLMVQRRYKAHPHYEQFFGSLVSAVNEHALSGSALDDLLTIFEKTMTNEPPAAMPKLLAAVHQMLGNRSLYQSRANSLKMSGGSFAFQYYDAEHPAPAFGKPYEPKSPEPEVKPAPKPEPPKPAPVAKAPAKKTTKKAAPKKPANDGWGTDDGWGAPEPAKADDGWGTTDDGWGAPAKPAAKKSTAKAAPKKADDGWGDPEPAASSGGGGKKADDGWGAGSWSDNPDAFDQPNPNADKNTGLLLFAPEPMPLVTGPALVLRDVDLTLATSFDSVGTVLHKTTGALMLSTGQFVGNGGTVTWEPTAGSPATATMGQYQFNVSKPALKAEGATLEYANVLEKPIDGVFEYRATRKDRRGQATYPRFTSFTNDARIKSLGDDVRYRGGFTLMGSKVTTSALDGSISTLTLVDRDSVRLRAQSHAFQLGDSLITAARAAVTMRQHLTDSITHPGIKFKYAKEKHLLTLVRGDGLYRLAPYFDSYHQLEIGAELVTWDVRSPYINFAMITAKNQVFASFASKDYFTNTYYQQQQSIASFHPMLVVYTYAKEKKTDHFYVADVAAARKINQTALHKSMVQLARDGFIDFNGMVGEITVKPKLRHYVNSAQGRTDYDHILLNSLSSAGKNATLDLQTDELLVRGVERFNFASDTVDVFMEPDSGRVRILKDRNMKFNGRLTANDLAFVGSDFQFDYKGFWVDMNKIDSTIVRNKQPLKKKKKGAAVDDDEAKGPQMVLTTRGKRSSGRLYLNRPDNKSGRKVAGSYPTFESQTPAFISFNDQRVQGGVYDSTVYFEVPPFKLDSLNSRNKTPVGLKGTFHSGGIFPPIQTEMHLMPDGSTGFVYNIPKEGLPAYGGKGTMLNRIKMDNGGIQGEGTLKVHGGTLKSEQFVFYLDSAVAVGQSATIAATAKTPQLVGRDYLMKWYAKRDSLAMTSQPDAPFKMYGKDSVTLVGTAVITDAGLVGSGTVENEKAILASENLTFKNDAYAGRHALFQIKTDDPKKPALKASDSNVTYNLAQGFAEFSPEVEGAATTELTGVQYRTSLPGGRWDLKRNRIVLKAPEGGGLAKSYFVSTRPEQRGLRWPAAKATYDLQKLELKADGVPYITVGDARIQPDSLHVLVERNGQIKPFEHAVVTMDTLTHFHRLYDGQIQIASRTRFTGSASYRYKTGQGDSTTIRFNDFRVDSASVLLRPTISEASGKKAKSANASTSLEPGLVTQARALVGDKEQVMVAPRVQYRGGVAIISRRRGLINDGEGKLRFSSTASASDWFAIRDSLDPNNLHFPIGGLHAPDGATLTTGLMRSDDSGKIYPLYVGVKQNDLDIPFFEVGGELAYNKSKDEFTLGALNRDGFEVNEGNVMTFSGKNGGVTWRGKNRFIGGNQNFNIEASSVGEGVPDSNQYKMDALLVFDMKGSGKMFDIMGSNLQKSTPQHPRAVQLSDNLTSKLGDFIGSKAAKDFNNVRPGQQPEALGKANSKFNRTLVINEVQLKWSRKNRAWYSVGPINVSNILGNNVNASLDGFLEIKRAPEGDQVEILLEADPNTWYYLKYAANVLVAWSGWEDFNREVESKQKGDAVTATEYGVFSGDDFQKDEFRTWFLKQYRSEEERRKLKRGTSAAPRPKPAAPPADAGTGTGGAATGTGTEPKKEEPAAPPANSNFSPSAPTDDPNAAPAEESGKKKKKKKEEAAPEPTAPAAEPANPNFSDEPAADDGGKKKKKKKKDSGSEDPFAEPTTP